MINTSQFQFKRWELPRGVKEKNILVAFFALKLLPFVPNYLACLLLQKFICSFSKLNLFGMFAFTKVYLVHLQS